MQVCDCVNSCISELMDNNCIDKNVGEKNSRSDNAFLF